MFTEKYRPKDFSEVIGQDKIVQNIMKKEYLSVLLPSSDMINLYTFYQNGAL